VPRLRMTPDGLLYAEHRRSLQTLLAYRRPIKERVLVAEIAGLFVLSSTIAILITISM